MYKAFFDGACSGNPGTMTIKFIVHDPQGQPIKQVSQEIGHGTNNIAEYQALIGLLEYLNQLNTEQVCIMGDSQVVINQVTKKWRISQEHLQVLADRVWILMKDHPDWRLTWIRREFNIADGVGSNR